MMSTIEFQDCSESNACGAGDGPDGFISVEELRRGSQYVDGVKGLVIGTDAGRKMIDKIRRLGASKSAVLIHGESGTGKELVAQAVHALGPAHNGPLVIFNCSNLVESLAESQLFGHVRGAFTDACEDSKGYFRAAGGGSLFLDEIGELPLRLQPKLLRAVETLEVQPIGSSKCFTADVRLIAATNRDLKAMVKAGEFREDLYYRLNTFDLYVPPLRERRESIAHLAAHFIRHFNSVCGKNVELVERAAIDLLSAYHWPGNVRELLHAIESALIASDGARLTRADLPGQVMENGGLAFLADSAGVKSASREAAAIGSPCGESAGLLLDDAIKRTLIRSLDEAGGNRRRAAGLMGVSRSTLYRMLSRYGIEESAEVRPRMAPR